MAETNFSQSVATNVSHLADDEEEDSTAGCIYCFMLFLFPYRQRSRNAPRNQRQMIAKAACVYVLAAGYQWRLLRREIRLEEVLVRVTRVKSIEMTIIVHVEEQVKSGSRPFEGEGAVLPLQHIS